MHGWEPARTTEYVYDDAGRLVESVTRSEVEWDDEQRAWMQALADLEQQSCSGCGGWLAETTLLAKSEAYVAEEPLRCHRCDALAIRRKAVQDRHNAEALTVWPVYERGQ